MADIVDLLFFTVPMDLEAMMSRLRRLEPRRTRTRLVACLRSHALSGERMGMAMSALLACDLAPVADDLFAIAVDTSVPLVNRGVAAEALWERGVEPEIPVSVAPAYAVALLVGACPDGFPEVGDRLADLIAVDGAQVDAIVAQIQRVRPLVAAPGHEIWASVLGDRACAKAHASVIRSTERTPATEALLAARIATGDVAGDLVDQLGVNAAPYAPDVCAWRGPLCPECGGHGYVVAIGSSAGFLVAYVDPHDTGAGESILWPLVSRRSHTAWMAEREVEGYVPCSPTEVAAFVVARRGETVGQIAWMLRSVSPRRASRPMLGLALEA